jgi:Fe-S cluster assembly protein SufD
VTAIERLTAQLRAVGEAGGPAWLRARREQAFAQFLERGLPTPRLEDWRFTDLRGLDSLALERPARAASDADLAERVRARVDGEPALVFVDGRLDPALSFTGEREGVRLESLASALSGERRDLKGELAALGDEKAHPFLALATALFEDGALVELAPRATPPRPLHLVFVHRHADASVHLRVQVRAGRASRATLVEHHLGAGAGAGLTNVATEILVEPGAHLAHVRAQHETPDRVHLGAVDVAVEREARYELFSLARGARLSRVEARVSLRGEGAHTGLFGLYLGRARQLADHHTTIDHAVAETGSEELFKGILTDRAHGVFHGRIHVRPGAQRIDAEQTSRALLLADGARVNTKPQLEIYADDVRCSHGASIGSLDADQLFYLRTRGVGEAEARALLAQGFARDILQRIGDERLRALEERAALDWIREAEAR